MAIITNTYLTYDSTGNREDLSDLIRNISPDDTPFLSAIGSHEATAVTHEWQTDELTAGENSTQVEGDDVTFPALTATTRVNNICQIMAKPIIVSNTQQAISKAGRKDEMAYQLSKAVREQATNKEYAFLNNATAVSPGAAATARQLKGVVGWITTNTTANAAAALTEANIEDTSSDVWSEGGKITVILCGAFNKRKISSFTTGVTKNLAADDHKLIKNIDVYETDFHMLKVMPSHQVAADDVHLLDTRLWSAAYLRRDRVEKLAKTGDAVKRYLVSELTLQCQQEKGNGNITGTATS